MDTDLFASLSNYTYMFLWPVGYKTIPCQFLALGIISSMLPNLSCFLYGGRGKNWCNCYIKGSWFSSVPALNKNICRVGVDMAYAKPIPYLPQLLPTDYFKSLFFFHCVQDACYKLWGGVKRKLLIEVFSYVQIFDWLMWRILSNNFT